MKLIREVKLYPTKTQQQNLLNLFEKARLFYNAVLERKINHYKKTGKNLSRFNLQKEFRDLNKEIPATLKQMMIYRVNTAYERFFNKLGHFPRFKSHNRLRSIELRQYEIDYRFKNNKLCIWKEIGHLKMKGFRKANNYGMGRIIKRASGWYFQYVVEVPEKKPIKKIKTAVGIDVGLKSFLVDSENNQVKPPKYFRKAQYKLRLQQRKVSKAKKGSNRRKKKIQLLAKVHEHIANQRKDFLHKLSRKYADKYDMVAVEKLNIRGMLKNHHLAKSIQDASWNIFTNMLSYKLRILGRHFIQVPPHYTSQKCSQCGAIVPKSLSIRTHICPECGFVGDRDWNASKNILSIGLTEAIGEVTSLEGLTTREELLS